jgi:hypothetical protein
MNKPLIFFDRHDRISFNGLGNRISSGWYQVSEDEINLKNIENLINNVDNWKSDYLINQQKNAESWLKYPNSVQLIKNDFLDLLR